MKYIEIKGVDKKVSCCGMGTMIFTPEKQDMCNELLDAFVQGGGTLIDTAEIYGAPEEYGYSELAIGAWIKKRGGHEDVVIMTKGCIPDTCKPIHPNGLDISAKSIHAAIDGSLKRLGVKYIDIWLLHRDDESVPVSEIMDALNEEVKRGRIKSFGGSNWSIQRLQEANEYVRANGLQEMTASSPHFSLAEAKEPYWPNTVVIKDEDKVWYEQNKMPVFAWSTNGRGFFFLAKRDYLDDENLVRVYYNDKNFSRLERAEILGEKRGLTRIEVATAYAVNQNFGCVALVGPCNVEQVKSCIKATEIELSGAEMDYLTLKTDEL